MNEQEKITDLGFSEALSNLRAGRKVARTAWDGRVRFVVLMPELYLPPFNHQEPGPKVNDRTAKHIGNDTPLNSQQYFAAFIANGEWQPGWVPSVRDLLANDWFRVV